MNLYFRSIGFSDIDGHGDLRRVVKAVTEEPDEQHILGINNADNRTDTYIECYKHYGERFGLMVRGTLDCFDDRSVRVEQCMPYTMADADTQCSHIDVECVGGEYIVTVCDDDSGNELVFSLQNSLDYIKDEDSFLKRSVVNISGMSLNGTIVLPVAKDDVSEQIRREEDEFYRELSRKAHAGDEQAQLLLDEQEAEISEIIRERLQDEDFLSVVEGFLLPLDDFDTVYSILGDINSVYAYKNNTTGETVYKLALDVTGADLEVFVNAIDMTGVPEVGMRYLGSCWLQGRVV